MHLAVVVPVDEGWVEVAGPGLDHTGNVDGGALLYEPLLKCMYMDVSSQTFYIMFYKNHELF